MSVWPVFPGQYSTWEMDFLEGSDLLGASFRLAGVCHVWVKFWTHFPRLGTSLEAYVPPDVGVYPLYSSA